MTSMRPARMPLPAMRRRVSLWRLTLIGALGCCLYAHRPVMPGPKQAEWATWHRTAGRYMRIAGPVLAVCAAVEILSRTVS